MTTVESFQVEVSPDRCRARVHYKGLSYNDFGSAKKLMPHRICRILESGRTYSFPYNYLLISAYVDKDYGVYVIGLHYTFHPAIWNIKNSSTFPFEIHSRISDVGKTSLTQEVKMINMLDQMVLATVVTKFVRVHRSTGRTSPLPAWLQDKFKSAVTSPRHLFLSRDVPQVPTSACMHEMTVEESDIDGNDHSNQTSYIRYCLDSAHAVVRQGKLPRFKPSLWNFPLLDIQAVFVKESFMGDRLLVFLWPQEDNPDVVRYVIKADKNGQQPVIFHAIMKFGHASVTFSHL